MTWQPIETAPKDRIVMLYGKIIPVTGQEDLHNLDYCVRTVGYWDGADQMWSITGSTWLGPWIDATHWAECLDPPEK